jgi:hypothetical protein
MSSAQFLALGIALLVVATLNFVPTMIAFARQHPERALLAKLNVLSLLSFLLWFALLVWAIGGARDNSVIDRFIGQAGNRGRLVTIVALLVLVGVGSTAYALMR